MLFHPKDVELKFTQSVSIYKVRKIVGFLLEARSNSKIVLIKTKCSLICHGNNDGNHGCFGQSLK